MFAVDVRRKRVGRMCGFRHWRQHHDEMYVKLGGEARLNRDAIDDRLD